MLIAMQKIDQEIDRMTGYLILIAMISLFLLIAFGAVYRLFFNTINYPFGLVDLLTICVVLPGATMAHRRGCYFALTYIANTLPDSARNKIMILAQLATMKIMIILTYLFHENLLLANIEHIFYEENLRALGQTMLPIMFMMMSYTSLIAFSRAWFTTPPTEAITQ